MFFTQKFSIFSICSLLFLNSLASANSAYLIFNGMSGQFSVLPIYKLLVSAMVCCFGGYLIYMICSRSLFAFKFCFWFSLLQLLTLENDFLAIGLNFKTKVGAVFEFNGLVVSLNVLALLVFIMTIKLKVLSKEGQIKS